MWFFLIPISQLRWIKKCLIKNFEYFIQVEVSVENNFNFIKVEEFCEQPVSDL